MKIVGTKSNNWTTRAFYCLEEGLAAELAA